MDNSPRTFKTCPHCGHRLSSISANTVNENQVLLRENAQLRLRIKELEEERDVQKELLENHENSENLEVEKNENVRLKNRGPFFLNRENDKVHVRPCIYLHLSCSSLPHSENWKEIDFSEIGNHRLTECCTNPEPLKVFEEGGPTALLEYQEQIKFRGRVFEAEKVDEKEIIKRRGITFS